MLIAAVSFAILGAALARCPLGSLQGLALADCYCYKQCDSVDSWYGAEDCCRMQGGHLASVTDCSANALLRDFALWNATDFWLGANEDALGMWKRTDSRNASYTNRRKEKFGILLLICSEQTRDVVLHRPPLLNNAPRHRLPSRDIPVVAFNTLVVGDGRTFTLRGLRVRVQELYLGK